MKLGLLYEAKPTIIPEGAPPDIYMEFENISKIEKIAARLEALGHTVELLDAQDDIISRLQSATVDLIFNYSIGFGGRSREMRAAAVLDLLGIPYTGSDSLAHGIAANKHIMKLVASDAGVQTARWRQITQASIDAIETFSARVVVKPVNEGSSIGIAGPIDGRDKAVLRSAVAHVQSTYDQPALVEEFVEGYEVTVPVLGSPPRFLPPLCLSIDDEVRIGDRMFSSRLKSDDALVSWTPNLPFEADLRQRLGNESVRLFRAVGCRDFARLDFRITFDLQPFFLEMNTTPQLTPDVGVFAISSRAAGLSYDRVLAEILTSASTRFGITPRTTPH